MNDINPAKLPGLVDRLVRERLGAWLVRWQGIRNSGQLSARQDAYLQVVYCTVRVWTLALALPYAGLATDGSGEALISGCQASALECCETIVLHSDALFCLPANLCVMVIYSALLALKVRPR
jgi:hypothetical protein